MTAQAPSRQGNQPQALKGVAKAAALLMALGPDYSAKVLQHLQEHEIEAITVKVATMPRLNEEEVHRVLEEAHEMAVVHRYLAVGGIEYAREMLARAMGLERANALIDRVVTMNPPAPFEFLRKSDPRQMAMFLQNEHPQTIALILSHLSPVQAAAVISHLNEDLQAEVARRIATIDRTPTEIVKRVEEIIRRRMSSLLVQDSRTVGGVPHLVAILSKVDRSTEKHILERLTEVDPMLAEEVRKLMFTFDDLILLDDRSLQRVLREVDMRDLALALKAARDELKEKIFRNMSQRAAELLREEISYLGPVRIRAVEEAQQRIVSVVRRLEEAEEIVISRGEEAILG
jgi:flagellar motor switch protein FliG